MEFRTPVDTPQMALQIAPCEDILCVGSCFADEMARRFRDNGFPVVSNPFGVMYNPASILHTIERYEGAPRVVFLTLGTNHVYRLKETGEIVDNCEKRPQRLFQEESLSVDACADYLQQTVDLLRQRNPEVQVVMTVSPIRYRKYGYHGSQLSKATLLLAADELTRRYPGSVSYFPAYEIVLDELRDYRFYQPDMLHPSPQAVEYIWERLVETCFSERAKRFLDEWRPVKQALAHRPFNPDSPEYQKFLAEARRKEQDIMEKYH